MASDPIKVSCLVCADCGAVVPSPPRAQERGCSSWLFKFLPYQGSAREWSTVSYCRRVRPGTTLLSFPKHRSEAFAITQPRLEVTITRSLAAVSHSREIDHWKPESSCLYRLEDDMRQDGGRWSKQAARKVYICCCVPCSPR